MNLAEVMAALATKGSEATRRLLLRHGARMPLFGVKIGDLKTLARALRGRQDLALQLYATGNGDAQYLAGLIADGRRMTRREVDQWARRAQGDLISGTIVPWVASEHPAGFALAVRWIGARDEQVARAGWNTLGALAATVADEDLPVPEFRRLLARVARDLPDAPHGVRYAMNAFVISVGTYVAPLGALALATARSLGKVEVDLGDTACRVPEAESYILKSRRGHRVAPKRRTIRC